MLQAFVGALMQSSFFPQFLAAHTDCTAADGLVSEGGSLPELDAMMAAMSQQLADLLAGGPVVKPQPLVESLQKAAADLADQAAAELEGRNNLNDEEEMP
jgi:hypothetical protein